MNTTFDAFLRDEEAVMEGLCAIGSPGQTATYLGILNQLMIGGSDERLESIMKRVWSDFGEVIDAQVASREHTVQVNRIIAVMIKYAHWDHLRRFVGKVGKHAMAPEHVEALFKKASLSVLEEWVDPWQMDITDYAEMIAENPHHEVWQFGEERFIKNDRVIHALFRRERFKTIERIAHKIPITVRIHVLSTLKARYWRLRKLMKKFIPKSIPESIPDWELGGLDDVITICFEQGYWEHIEQWRERLSPYSHHRSTIMKKAIVRDDLELAEFAKGSENSGLISAFSFLHGTKYYRSKEVFDVAFTCVTDGRGLLAFIDVVYKFHTLSAAEFAKQYTSSYIYKQVQEHDKALQILWSFKTWRDWCKAYAPKWAKLSRQEDEARTVAFLHAYQWTDDRRNDPNMKSGLGTFCKSSIHEPQVLRIILACVKGSYRPDGSELPTGA